MTKTVVQSVTAGDYRPAKRYQVVHFSDIVGVMVDYDNPWIVLDDWTRQVKGRYPTKATAQARARLLNSRSS